MAKRSTGEGMWLAVGVLVLAVMIPKKVWIGAGVIGVSAVVVYLIIKHLRQRADAKRDAYRHEPTLAELIAANELQRSALRAVSPPSLPSRSRTTLEHSLVSQSPPAAKLTGESAERLATDQAAIEVNREHVQPPDDEFYSTSSRREERRSSPVHSALPIPATPHAPQDGSSLVGGASGSQAIELLNMSKDWNSARQALVEANRKRAQSLRDALPLSSQFVNERMSAPVMRSPSATSPEPPMLPRMGERGAAEGSPLAPAPSPYPTETPLPKLERTIRNLMSVFQGLSEPEHLYSVKPNANAPLPPAHALPAAPAGFGEGRWIPPGESVTVAGVTLTSGMLYVGGRLKALSGDAEPCLISGQHTVARVGNYRTRQMGYWPSYAEASPEERRAYLNWLSDGRSDPDCDIGYVFLFFYGLERRVIVDSRSDASARNDWPAIVVELRRLLVIYGDKSGTFNRCAGELLSWIELDGKSGQLYARPVPDFPRTYELPPYLRLALGQAAFDRAPLPAHLALAWIRLSPACSLRTAAMRCPNEFGNLFAQRYHEVFGSGLVLPKNRTKLKFVYQPASAGLHGANITMAFGDVPDVTALTAPVKKLMDIANQCTDELGSYSRLIGKDPAAAETMEGLLLLPAAIWPSSTQAKLRALTAQMCDGRLSLTLKDLITALGGANQVVNRDRVRSLARSLEDAEIGMEPHVLAGAKAPGEQDTVVLFVQPFVESDVGSRAEYQMAALTLQLASVVAQADGIFHDREIAHLRAEVEAWSHLTLAERRRLHAHLQWLTASPMSLASLKKKLEPLPVAARETLAAFMAALAQADGLVSPEEVKFLEKVYKALGVESKRVFSDIHTAGSGGASVSIVRDEKQGFRLDAGRIAALQEDTARVSALLSKIFVEEVDNAPALVTPAHDSEHEGKGNAPLGLDQDHSALLRLLLSRPDWTRAELEDAAADLDLMLDGALEQINEAAFDAFDEPLFEGEDPISVNTKLLEKIEA